MNGSMLPSRFEFISEESQKALDKTREEQLKITAEIFYLLNAQRINWIIEGFK